MIESKKRPGRIETWRLKRAINEYEYATGVGVHVGMHGTWAGDTGPSPAQVLARDDELAVKHVYELREVMFMQREPCTGLEAHDLHLQTAGHRNVFDGNAGGKCGWLPGQVIAGQTQKFTVIKFDHGVHPRCVKDEYQTRDGARTRLVASVAVVGR